MKAQKIRDLDDAELKQQLGEANEQMFRLQFQMATGQMEGLKKALAFPMYATAAWLLWVLSLRAGPTKLAELIAADGPLQPEDIDRISPELTIGFKRFPTLERAGIRR